MVALVEKPRFDCAIDQRVRLNEEEQVALIHRQHAKIVDLKSELSELTKRLARAEDQLREADGRLNVEDRMRSSLEVLQRMANGVDPFNRDRMQCAMAALPHETPKLTAAVTVNEHRVGYAGRLSEARIRAKYEALGLKVIDGRPIQEDVGDDAGPPVA